MEVHTHTHTADPDPSTSSGHRGRKKWTHYFREFLMLFLAVFCGFLAENQREHIVEAHRAKEYARSLLNDLREDTTELRRGIEHIAFLITTTDSFSSIVSKNYNKNAVPGTFYYYCRFTSFSYPVDWNSSTINQLIQSGNLRYFKNKDLVNKINKYYAFQLIITSQGENDMIHREKIRDLRNLILDNRFYAAFAPIVFSREVKGHVPSPQMDSLMKQQLPLQEGGGKYLAAFLNHLGDRRERLVSFIGNWYPGARARAEKIMKMLIEEYNLK